MFHMLFAPTAGAMIGIGGSLVIALVIGLIVALIVVGVMKSELKSVSYKRQAQDYVVPNSLKLRTREDVFLYKKVDKQLRQQPSQQPPPPQHRP